MKNTVIKASDLSLMFGLKLKEVTYNYLSEEDLIKFRMIEQLRDGTLTPPSDLMTKVYMFDSAYRSSTDSDYWRKCDLEADEITNEIADSDHPAEEKRILQSGLNGKVQMQEQWPVLLVYIYLETNPRGEVGLALAGINDSDIESLKKTLHIAVDAILLSNIHGKIVSTRAAPRPDTICGKVTVSPIVQQMVLGFESSLTRDKLSLMAKLLDCGKILICEGADDEYMFGAELISNDAGRKLYKLIVHTTTDRFSLSMYLFPRR